MKTAVIADIHGNSPALRAVLDDIRGSGCGRLVFLGDVINGPDPRGSLELLLGWPGVRCLKGNAEQYLCVEELEGFPWRDRPDWRWIFPALSDWRDQIGPQLLAEIATWPDEIVLDDAWMVHASPLEIPRPGEGPAELPERYRVLGTHGYGLVPSTPRDRLSANAEEVKRKGLQRLFIGHTHMPFSLVVDGVTICNAGSAGMPLDGDPRGSWIAWDGTSLEVRRVAYDIDGTLRLVARHIRDPERRRNYEWMFSNASHWRQRT